MGRLSEETIAALKDAHPLDAMIETRTKLGRANAKGIRAGQCLCEPVRGKAPLWVQCGSNAWGCLKPNGCGGDVFDYLRQTEGLDFAGAVARLGGAEAVADPALVAAMAETRAAAKAERAARQAALDEQERERAWKIWCRAAPAGGTLVDAYFNQRGLVSLATSPVLRFSADEPFYAEVDKDAPPIIIHRGPCMVAAIQRPDGSFGGVHRTWLDPRLDQGRWVLDADGNLTKGQATIALPDGTPADAKKMRGLKKRGAIRLKDPSPYLDETWPRVLIVGEGIETTAAALQALELHGLERTDYCAWAAGDLGNMSGGTLGPATPHPERPGRFVPSDEPDMADPGVEPPDWATRIILLGDGDSDPLVTRARLHCARTRFVRLGTPTVIRMAPAGRDFVDLARMPR